MEFSVEVSLLVVAFKMVQGPQVSLAQQTSTSGRQHARHGLWAWDGYKMNK